MDILLDPVSIWKSVVGIIFLFMAKPLCYTHDCRNYSDYVSVTLKAITIKTFHPRFPRVTSSSL